MEYKVSNEALLNLFTFECFEFCKRCKLTRCSGHVEFLTYVGILMADAIKKEHEG